MAMKKLFINRASYFVEDSTGNSVKVLVNYWENKFGLRVLARKNDNIKLLKAEAREIAHDLLKRKSRINLAK